MTAKHQQDTSSFGEFVASLKGGDGKPQANRFRDRKGNSAHTNFPSCAAICNVTRCYKWGATECNRVAKQKAGRLTRPFIMLTAWRLLSNR